MNKTVKNGHNDILINNKTMLHFTKKKKKFPTTEFEILANTSNNTFTNFILRTIKDNSILVKKNTIVVNDKKEIVHNVNKSVKFKSPLIDVIDIPSMKLYNSKMTYNDCQGEGEVLLSSKKCCSGKTMCQIY